VSSGREARGGRVPNKRPTTTIVIISTILLLIRLLLNSRWRQHLRLRRGNSKVLGADSKQGDEATPLLTNSRGILTITIRICHHCFRERGSLASGEGEAIPHQNRSRSSRYRRSRQRLGSHTGRNLDLVSSSISSGRRRRRRRSSRCGGGIPLVPHRPIRRVLRVVVVVNHARPVPRV
jgi:hypothetical protein